MPADIRGSFHTRTSGLPIGVQIVGHPWQEHVVLAVAKFLESAMGGWQPVPALRACQSAAGYRSSGRWPHCRWWALPCDDFFFGFVVR
jgi:hypothetical protein